MGFDYQAIRLSQIAEDDLSFRISTQHAIDTLADSIDRFGLINAPILACQRDNYIVVSGFRRISACRHLGWGQTPARVLPTQTSLATCIQFAVVDNTAHRELNLVEQARVVQLLAKVHNDPLSVVQQANAMGMAINARMLEKINNINMMPDTLQQGLIDGSISLPTALRIYSFQDPAAHESLSELLCELNMSLNRQRELLDWVEAIVRRDQLSVDQLLADEQLCQWRHDETLDRPQKIQRIREFLRMRRYPAISAARKRYEATRRQLKLKNGIQLVPPENFEGSTHTLQLHFTSSQMLNELTEECQRLAQSPLIHDLIDPFDPD